MKRKIAILVVGLLIIGYGQFLVPNTVEKEVCDESKFEQLESDTDCQEFETETRQNPAKDRVRIFGLITAVAGGFLVLGG